MLGLEHPDRGVLETREPWLAGTLPYPGRRPETSTEEPWMVERLNKGDERPWPDDGAQAAKVTARLPLEQLQDTVRCQASRVAELEDENSVLRDRVQDLQRQTRMLDNQVFDMFAISQAGKLFMANPDPNRLSELLLAMIHERLGVDRMALLLADDASGAFRLVQSSGLDLDAIRKVKYQRQDGLLWNLLNNGEPFSVVDFEGNQRFARVFEEQGLDVLQATLWVPMKTKDQVVGIITLGAGSLNERDLNFLSLLTAQAAVGLETANLYRKVGESTAELDRQMHHLSILYDIGRALNFIDDLTKLLALILDRGIHLVDAQKGSLMLYDEKTNELVVRVVRGIDRYVEEQILSGEIQCTRLKKGEGIAGRVFATREPVILHEPRDDSRYLESRSSRIENIICVPLKVYDEPIGVINITNKKGGQRFTEEDLKIICGLAEQAAVAINNARLYELAVTDSLTRLYIRRHLMQRLEEELRRARRYKHSLSVCMLDLDNFKQLNDRHGHVAGDRLLSEFARILRRCSRASDILGRYGGDEFCTVLPETPFEGALAFADRVIAELAQNLEASGTNDLNISVSIGVASFPNHGEDVDSLIQSADRALYRAKEDGRDCVRGALPEDLEGEMKHAGEQVGPARAGHPPAPSPE